MTCFHDENYLCLCQRQTSTAECLLFDRFDDKCSKCMAGGRCIRLKGDEYSCLCPPCHKGADCQLNFETFSFTIDQLFLIDLNSKNPIVRLTSFSLLVFVSSILFIFGFLNNLCCFFTFQRKACRQNGIGEYLFYMSIINQVNILTFFLRFVYLTVNLSTSNSWTEFDTIGCKALHFILALTTRLTYLLGSLIAIERFYVVLFLHGRWLKSPKIARRIFCLVFVIIFIVSLDDWIFVTSEQNRDYGNISICIISIPSNSTALKFIQIIVTCIEYLTPVLINLICTLGIIIKVFLKKANTKTGTGQSKYRTRFDHEKFIDSLHFRETEDFYLFIDSRSE